MEQNNAPMNIYDMYRMAATYLVASPANAILQKFLFWLLGLIGRLKICHAFSNYVSNKCSGWFTKSKTRDAELGQKDTDARLDQLEADLREERRKREDLENQFNKFVAETVINSNVGSQSGLIEELKTLVKSVNEVREERKDRARKAK
uniref:Uncharacterized protein n=1 Tax=Acrobeloides nanus TaxID=290746 RepID=A0A914EPZ8_9BILA